MVSLTMMLWALHSLGPSSERPKILASGKWWRSCTSNAISASRCRRVLVAGCRVPGDSRSQVPGRKFSL